MEQDKKKYGIVGLILSGIVLPTLGITAIPAIIVCLLGLGQEKRRKRSLYGLLVTGISLIVLFWIFIPFTSPDSLPDSLEHYKFKRACSHAAFWLDYKKETITDVRSQNTFILVRHGAILYRGETNEFQKQDVIDYAEANGWKFHLSLPLFKEDFIKFDNNSFDDDKDYGLSEFMFYFKYAPILIKDDCEAMAFETGNVHGYTSLVFISTDGSEMVVYYDSPSVPDPVMKFWLPFGFEELSNQRMKTN